MMHSRKSGVVWMVCCLIREGTSEEVNFRSLESHVSQFEPAGSAKLNHYEDDARKERLLGLEGLNFKILWQPRGNLPSFLLSNDVVHWHCLLTRVSI